MNFPMQAAGSEMMRLATINICKAGITCHAIVHDAFLVSSEIDRIDETVKKTHAAMAEASRVVLGGNALKMDAETFRHPRRFPEKRGQEVWQMLQESLPGAEAMVMT